MPPKKGATKAKSKRGKKAAQTQETQSQGETPALEETPAQPIVTEEQPSVERHALQDEQMLATSSAPSVPDPNAAISPAEGDKRTDPPINPEPPSMTMEERTEKLNALRLKMRQSAQANRADLISESQQLKTSAKDAVRLEKQRRLHETLRLKADAEERGEDAERAKNWEYTIEENDDWEKRLKRKKTRADFEFHDDAHAARRKYKKDLDHLRPNLAVYNAQKEKAMGYTSETLAQGASSAASELNNLQVATVSAEQRLAAESLYRDANSLLYADNQPSEEAIDRVVSKLNLDLDKRGKRSRKRLHEDDGDITYINERNRVFNKKIARYYDKYTSEIRASFERGTAL